MAPRKRVRDIHDVDGESDVEIESASSSFRMNSNHTKRTRIAIAQASRGSVVSDEEDFLNSDTNDINIDDESDVETANNPDIDYSLRQDSSDDDCEDDGFDELKATQIVHRQFKEHRENIAADHGVVEEIYCTNFMCHAKLRITLGPLINFIIGHNGSGKSAVLTALQICLGTKASETSRGRGLKALIKEGTDKATVGVTIKNEGESAYKPELYGRSITVERHFTHNSSGFKLKSAAGTTISTKKSDLDDMLDYFSLQMDNPINVLTQDKARAFLSNSTPTEKYKFFMKGTQLEILNGDYKLIEENLDNTSAKMRQKEEDIQVLKRQYEEADRRKKRSDNTRKMYARIKETQREWAWSQIEVEEQELQRREQDVAKGRDDLTEAEQAAEEATAALEAQESAVDGQKRAIEEHQRSLRPLQEAYNAAKEKWDNNRKALVDNKAEERRIQDDFKRAKRNIAQVSQEIETERQRLAGEHGEAHAQRLIDLDRLKKLAVDAKQAHQDHEEGLPALEAAVVAAKQRWTEAKDPVEGARTEHERVKKDLDTLQRDQGQKWGAYPRNSDKLCHAIERETRWRKKPIGPIGMHIAITKPLWSPIVERICGKTLNAFVVTCKYDRDILDQLANRVGASEMTVFITTDVHINVDEPDPAVDTVMRILNIESEAIRNTLVINHAIEQTVLFEDLDKGRDFMFGEGHRPPNVRATITLHPHNKSAGQRWDYDPYGGVKVGPVAPWQGRGRMIVDKQEEIRLASERVQEAARKRGQTEQHAQHMQNEHTKAGQAVVAHKRESRRLKEAYQRADDNVDAKQAEIDANQPRDGRLQELQRQEEEHNQEKKAAEDSMQDAAAQNAELNANARVLKDELEAADDEKFKVKDLIDKAEKKLSDLDDARKAALVRKNETYDIIDLRKHELAELEEAVEQKKKQIEEWIPEAEKVAPERVPVNSTPDALEKLFNTLQADYEKEQATQGGTRQQIAELWKKAAEDFRRAKKDHRTMRNVIQLLTKTLAERHRRWGLFRGHISMRTRINFNYLLTERNFRGRLNFKHSEKTLDLTVEPDMTKQSDTGRQTKTLSGGEKSFSTICLLLSIWEAMGSPIRCLDEFDVFMDSVNRLQSMKLMIQTARRSVGRQFILITPQAMGNVEFHDDVTIHKMKDPERNREPGQQALDFGGA
ncbi:uncharacterized protein MYCFIDRAFT_216987 [Pseudocercospora fijiensis CIRAD86]|uniref:RecF/RecN/SMC N-terminal domain-containing protein n=1 Tax=Pseudocercospora fijiensis (strain CIRAD86) TaxID=383855 RepID=M3AKZ6_PSEFD|nr:uncharacterized protein MYCFIDRAFT_216987 [Pseudocercospora fijiensis CIRAD86]EME78132.1 hypothetical protein MYCFIDRAFT_216987 [Pseudocercospora fijiensis CIRAD86]